MFRITHMRPALFLITVLLTLGVAASASAATWPADTHQVSLAVDRVEGADRYATAVAVAKAGWPGWAGIDRVIIASGEPRSYADPLAAGSLCWAYDAPLMLVESDRVPSAVKSALAAIHSANGGVDVTIVGGPGAVSGAVVSELRSLITSGTVEQPWTVGDRYTTAARVAARSAQVASETSRTVPARAFIANGTDRFGFVDALALSAVSARTGVPVLLVQPGEVPLSTASALRSLPIGDVIVAGGTTAVTNTVYSRVGATSRWGGPDRYATSVAIARGARTEGWLTGETVGVAAAIPDALTGSTYAAKLGGPLLYSEKTALAPATAYYLAGMQGTVSSAVVFGGPNAVSTSQERELGGAPSAPLLVAPSDSSYVAKKANVRVRTGVNTSEVKLFVGSTLIATRPATSYAVVDFGLVAVPAEGISLRVVATNPDGKVTETSAKYRRLAYPAATSIVIDKSDFRIYLVQNDVLVESYPIAIGRPGMETPTRLWKINSKYYTDPNGVYGPRKMRLYAQAGSTWVYTAYGIHGTNEPWVIGTKASHGCIRLYNEDILDLFPRVRLGTLVLTRE
ncbi:cell wall-binding repeat-containing protein [Anaerosoma tenue]|uniref:cell wall-binding repeat-containing protein n=1 Tax=Anaerosoma tenue TaxID=2933588 RepID=UPI0022609E0D|nr:cell wall-binding repeat-containing protein [Anaerosoma tenue]MCK8113974.1 cell wall-binding repeat-containing protein [Anaerosoma tenue]